MSLKLKKKILKNFGKIIGKLQKFSYIWGNLFSYRLDLSNKT